MITPREIIRDFVTILDLLYTNTDKSFADIAGGSARSTAPSSVDEANADDALADAPTEKDPAPAVQTEKPKITLDDIEF